ncbi:YciI family protein [Serratia sp. UGAL515B_01]|uniref:YciI family protein n=1 Tax=Serratia sp. UGAL515B_01 TaxID=2986763 RepID=UPI0029559C91|nr:YciI family protein [Serratia sp. UGAL515B_01]WON78335.1 YciI family protein [Serratia sp. UGAL515B_01]
MYIVNLTYHRPIEEVENHLAAHVTWLKRYFQDGNFIASGRKKPRTGGVILVKDMARTQLDTILAEDPFDAIAHYEVTDVALTATSAGFESLFGI